MMATPWQGPFPWQSLLTDGYEGPSPVGSFPANGYGLQDMTGNVWEWTCDYFTPRHPADAAHACCVPRNPRVRTADRSRVAGEPAPNLPRKVIKAGSHLRPPTSSLPHPPPPP